MTTRVVVLNKDTSHRKIEVREEIVGEDGNSAYGSAMPVEPGGSFTTHVYAGKRLVIEELPEERVPVPANDATPPAEPAEQVVEG